MCQISDAIQKYYPSMPKDKWQDFCFHCTAYPCVDADWIVGQIQELGERTGDNYELAMQISADEMDAAHEHGKHCEISESAYHLWLSAGSPEGRDVEFWCAAEHEYHYGRIA